MARVVKSCSHEILDISYAANLLGRLFIDRRKVEFIFKRKRQLEEGERVVAKILDKKAISRHFQMPS